MISQETREEIWQTMQPDYEMQRIIKVLDEALTRLQAIKY